ncbi:unnamed protein product [Paramecium pentaurelia]|uniref:Transmembrane protein n=1 Tax=Paramecium pentaurelia TaxID=43138 RepID=A0A8S1XWE4_9CILI|nr:unnamed protein product [Paramecium pentaurelia]
MKLKYNSLQRQAQSSPSKSRNQRSLFKAVKKNIELQMKIFVILLVVDIYQFVWIYFSIIHSIILFWTFLLFQIQKYIKCRDYGVRKRFTSNLQ